VAVSPETFKLDGETKAVVIDPDLAADDVVIMAAKSCPTQAIIIYDKEGKQLFP
jgi:ferredoxin